MVSGNARNISLTRSSRVSCRYVHLYPRSSNCQVLTFHLSIVPLALHPILQPLPRPRQTIHPSPLHTHLPIQKVLDIHLHHDGLPHHCGTVDGLQWISLCIPVSDFWKLDRVPRHCLPEGPVWYANAAMQIITDVVILVLPMPLLSKLHLPRRQKVGTMLVFGVGIL